MLPIHRLPTELFTSILLIDLGDVLVRQHARKQRLWQFALVASKWWKTVSQSPMFWTDIVFTLDDPHLYLRKSQNALLNIACVGFHREAEGFMEVVATAAHRWKSIALLSTAGQDLAWQLRNQMPELTDMRISARVRTEFPGVHTALLQLQDMPKLKHLCLDHVDLQWENVKLGHLHSLQLANIEATAPSLDQLLAILRSSPDLEQLALSNIRFTTDRGPPLQTRIRLPRLKSLQLTTLPREILELLVATIESPHLTAVKLVGCPDSYFVGNTNSAAEAPLMKYLPSILGRLDEIHITSNLKRRLIEVTSSPRFGGSWEWVSWAVSPRTIGLHIAVPMENARRSLERVITLLSEAGLREAARGRVRFRLQGDLNSLGALPADSEGAFDAELLAKLPTITHISAVNSTDARGILRHLGQCRQHPDGTWGYLCPRLEVLDIGGTDEKVEREDIDTFLSGRYADGEPFYQGNHLVMRPPDLIEFFLPPHLQEESGDEVDEVDLT
ncbi:hypothetical protein FRC01_014672 [Tulasnella sp. 417]|nr:hypothetical protein FRC01_014672 [Tulasnella sp. 417]